MEQSSKHRHGVLARIPRLEELRAALYSFNPKQRLWVGLVVLAFILSSIWLVGTLSAQFATKVPVSGGHITEGILGTPRFVNPILALSEADRDLSLLVYAGLMRKLPDGSIIPDLAESYTVSDDGKQYTFTLRDTARFHDGKRVRADDVEFTIARAQNPSTRSPLQLDWSGITVEAVDDRTVRVTLNNPFPAFLAQMTIGILPEHLWHDIPADQMSYSEMNVEPIGAGPFQIKKTKQRPSGLIESFTLKRFRHFSLGKPYIKRITLKFYPNREALYSAYRSGSVDQVAAVDPQIAYVLQQNGTHIETGSLPRIFGLFLNASSAPIFADPTVVDALNAAIDRREIIRTVLFGYGTAIDGPLPESMYQHQVVHPSGDPMTILEDGGWQLGDDQLWRKELGGETRTLSFTISTGDAAELKDTVFSIKEQLAAIHIPVKVAVYEVGNLNQNSIRSRDYQALFFGEIISNPSDLYTFWHSSQRNDPGLNIALFANKQADALLEKLRTETDRQAQEVAYEQLHELVKDEASVVFVYSPSFIYVLPKRLQGVNVTYLTTSAERFSNVYQWYMQTDTVWNFLYSQ